MLTLFADQTDGEAATFCKEYLKSPAKQRYVLGRNEYAVSLSTCIEVAGFIDDYTDDTVFLDKPVLKMLDVPKDSMVVSTVIFVLPLTAMTNLRKNGLRCLDYFSFIKYSALDFKKIDFLDEAKGDILDNMDKYQWVYDRLADEPSKQIFEKLVNFRVSSDIRYLQGFTNNPEGQYFEEFLHLETDEVFVDAGGFDGQTAIDFIDRCPDYRSIHFFEPDPKNLDIARERLSGYSNIHFHNCGVGDESGIFQFSSGSGSASMVSASGDMEIQVDTIDRVVGEPVSLIKMDIEGFERPALDGAKHHILQDQPKLAICCYHKFDDLWVIPEQVLKMRSDYLLYLRHYTEGLHESVWYFIPVN